MTGIPYASAKTGSQLVAGLCKLSYQRSTFFFFFFSACIVINSATVRGPRGVSKVETQRLALSEITSRAEVLKRLRQPLQT